MLRLGWPPLSCAIICSNSFAASGLDCNSRNMSAMPACNCLANSSSSTGGSARGVFIGCVLEVVVGLPGPDGPGSATGGESSLAVEKSSSISVVIL